MPEIVEVYLNSQFINTIGAQEVPIVDIAFSHETKNKILPIKKDDYLFSSETRGKELALDLFDLNKNFKYRILFALGMSGNFSLSKQIEKHYMVYFKLKNGFYLGFHDIRRYGKWKLSTTQEWSYNRGPDPIREEREWVSEVWLGLKTKKFEKPIYEVLMDQKYFNGTGNYLRSIILYRIGGDFRQSAKDYIQNHKAVFFKTIQEIIKESYTLQAEGKMTNAWYYPYGQGKSFEDSNKRKFWYH